MLKKTIVVVGALMAATISLPDIAEAAPHHHVSFQRIRSGARASYRPRVASRYRPRLMATRAWTGYHAGFARGRFGRGLAWRRPFGRRLAAWRRPVSARAYSAYAPVATPTSPLAPLTGLLPGAPAAPAVAAPARTAAGGQTGRASFYGLHSRTASGGLVGAATCAHRSLPFGTRVLVTNLANARQAVLTVNDRGPFVRGRIVDVSVGAAGMLGMLHSGTAPVRVQVVGHSG